MAKISILPWLAVLSLLPSLAAASERAYLALENAGALAVLDLSTGRELDRITVGPLPRYVALSEDGRIAAVVNDGDRTISVIDLEQGAVTDTLAIADIVPAIPQVVIDEMEDAWEAEDGEDILSISGMERGIVSGGEIALSPDGETLYLSSVFWGISAYDRSSGTIRPLAGAAGETGRFATNMMGKLWLSRAGDFAIVASVEEFGVVDTATMRMTAVIDLPSSLMFMTGALASDGSRFVGPPVLDISQLSTQPRWQVLAADLETFAVEPIAAGNVDLRTLSNFARGMSGRVDMTLSRDGRRLYAVKSRMGEFQGTVAAGGGVAVVSGAEEHELTVVDLETSETTSAMLASSPGGLDLCADDSRIALVYPNANQVEFRDSRSLDVVATVEIGPTPRAGGDFIRRTAGNGGLLADPVDAGAGEPSSTPLPNIRF